jgi:hypothetical protein
MAQRFGSDKAADGRQAICVASPRLCGAWRAAPWLTRICPDGNGDGSWSGLAKAAGDGSRPIGAVGVAEKSRLAGMEAGGRQVSKFRPSLQPIRAPFCMVV